MGNSQLSSKIHLEDERDKEYRVLMAQREMQKSMSISVQVMTAHYTPSSFPVHPRINKAANEHCVQSWKRIIETDVQDPYGGPGKSGITAFYSEFYERYIDSHPLCIFNPPPYFTYRY